MLKKILAVFFVLALSVGLCACDDLEIKFPDIFGGGNQPTTEGASQTVDQSKAPEEIAKDFIKAYYGRDAVKFFEYIPEFTYGAMMRVLDVPYEEGADAKAVLFEFLANEFDSVDEPAAESVDLVTKISTDMTAQDYRDALAEAYIPEGLMTKAEIDALNEVVIVAFEGTVKYPNGDEDRNGGGSFLPCIKIDGKWYVDFFFAAIVAVPINPSPMQTSINVPVD